MYNNYFGFRNAPFGVTPDANLFYSNPVYQEAFATLSYGIKEKKGFILITGEAGTGKTTLLRRLMRSFDVTTRSVLIHNTCLNFTELLQLTLWELDLAEKHDNRVVMIGALHGYLIEQLKKGRSVALLIDEAQNLNDETLESLRLLSNLETDNQKLLQVVLVGQPELESKLDQPHLRQLKQRVALRCRLAPLKSAEVGPYISFRLQMAGHEKNSLFHPDAIVWIASYSKGIPRLINVICNNALLIAYAGSRKQVGAEIIHEVAQDLRLGEQPRPKRESRPSEFRIARGRQDIFPAPHDEVNELGYAISKELEMREAGQPRRRRPMWRAPLASGFVLALLLFGAAGVAFYPLQPGDYLSYLAFKMNDYIGSQGEDIEQAKSSREILNNEFPDAATDIQTPPAQEPALSEEDENQHVTSLARRDELHEPQPSAPEPEAPVPAGRSGFLPLLKPELPRELPAAEPQVETSPTSTSNPPDEVARGSERQKPIQISEDPKIRRRKIQIEIYKAMHNRAITGVNASLIDGIAYLHGEVATERQKLAAERAARSVPGVDYVRNRIVVK